MNPEEREDETIKRAATEMFGENVVFTPSTLEMIRALYRQYSGQLPVEVDEAYDW